MGTYTKILAAVDLTDEAADVLAAAHEVAKEQGAQLHVLTAIRPLRYAYGGLETAGMGKAMERFEPEARAAALKTLQGLCEPLDIAQDNIHINFGYPVEDIKSTADKLGIDLIVLGTHGRHGLGLLLGSTANGVLHGSPCDVLTVRIHNEA